MDNKLIHYENHIVLPIPVLYNNHFAFSHCGLHIAIEFFTL